MAVKVKNFELPDQSILEEAYLKIQTINTINLDYEKYEPLNETDVKLTWDVRMETKATVFVYADEFARANRVAPLQWFSYEFDYNIDSPINIYSQAYEKLIEIYPEGTNC